MLSKEEIIKLISDMDKYIGDSAKYASQFYCGNNIEFEFFEGTKMTMSEDVCKSVYKDIIYEMLTNQGIFLSKYGLFVAVTPMRDGDGTMLMLLHLGVSFPHT